MLYRLCCRALALLLLCVLVSCGQKGPLQRPDQTPMQLVQHAPGSAPAGNKILMAG